MADGRFWFIAARSSAEAYLRTSPPRGHSTVGVSKRCEGFVAIWLRAREVIAANRFQLLFINKLAVKPAFGGLHCYGAPSTATVIQRQSLDGPTVVS